MKDTVNAFINLKRINGSAVGPLAGLTVAVKDIYDIEGEQTGCGNPVWASTHGYPTGTASAVTTLLSAGATVVGKTHTDELAYSLMGANAHYGTPINVAAPDRVPGGSSSGSAAATAAGLVDIGLGSDTGGSVRLPAAFCGVFGLRPTHGRIPLDRTMPLAPSFDVVGWFTRDLATMTAVAAVFGLPTTGPAPARLLLPVDAWAGVPVEVGDALAPFVSRLQDAMGAGTPWRIAPEPLADWREVFRICQASEIWETHGEWVQSANPHFGPGVAERFRAASAIGPEERERARTERARIATGLRDRLGEGAVVVLPAAPGPAPKRDATAAELDAYRAAALAILCPAGIAGLPQLSIPAATVDGAPVGLSLLAARDGEALLFAAAAAALC